MNEKLPSAEQSKRFLREENCSAAVINHSRAVAELALRIAKLCDEKGIKVNFQLVLIGALLHDIGRSRTHTVHHAIVGAKIAEFKGLPESVISIIKRHVGGGITAEEAEKLGWPRDVYTPATLEEKIVSYADKRIQGSKISPIEKAIAELTREKKFDAAERVEKLHIEMVNRIGDSL